MAIVEIGAGSESQLRHSRMELLEAEIIARSLVGGGGADAHPDYPYAQAISTGSVARKITQEQANTAFRAIINSRYVPLGRILKLRPVHGAAADELNHVRLFVDILDSEKVSFIEENVLRTDSDVRVG